MDAHGRALGQLGISLGLGRAGDDGNETFVHHCPAFIRQARTQNENIFVQHGGAYRARRDRPREPCATTRRPCARWSVTRPASSRWSKPMATGMAGPRWPRPSHHSSSSLGWPRSARRGWARTRRPGSRLLRGSLEHLGIELQHLHHAFTAGDAGHHAVPTFDGAKTEDFRAPA